MRVESGEVGTLNDAGKPGHFCVAESVVSKLETSSRHTVVRSKPDPWSKGRIEEIESEGKPDIDNVPFCLNNCARV